MITAPLLAALLLAAPGDRSYLPLDGIWDITKDDPTRDDAEWGPVAVPASFETALGLDHDGVASYRTWFYLPEDFAGERLMLHFDGAATRAHVWVNGELAGGHLGAWTAFRVDVTSHVRRGEENELVVMMDEKVGHNTQGFLPIIAPHFGGLWQSVVLIGMPYPWIDDLEVMVRGDADGRRLLVDVPIRPGIAANQHLVIEADIEGKHVRHTTRGGERLEIPVAEFERWDVDRPTLYPVTIRLVGHGGKVIDRHRARVGFRSVRAEGRTLLLNDRPLNVRGLLEWGYFPPLLAPNVSDDVIRSLIADAKARGFNLVKFCLWLPPHRVLDLFDEAGMLTWVEYPTWHPQIDFEHRDNLLREFGEFFEHDRVHPSVILRSLTCETGHDASLEVIRALYDLCKARIPGDLVEDDSSWITWHRIHDFYDDHPYGNNDTWPEVLDGLNRHIEEREPKPLLLGEAIAADTWVDRSTVRNADEDASFWRPIGYAAQHAWEERVAARFGRETIGDLVPNSLRFALNERKDQIETFRQVVPDGGYVVSVARDFKLASMGLNDHQDRPKWRSDEWDWHGDTMLLLGRGTSRSLRAGETNRIPMLVAHHGEDPIPAGRIQWRFGEDRGDLEHGAIPPGGVTGVGELELTAPASDAPTELVLRAHLAGPPAGPVARNRWSFWSVPSAETPRTGMRIANTLTMELLDEIRGGARVLIETADVSGSFAAPAHWLLRGSPWFPPHPLRDVPNEMFLDLTVKDVHPKGLLPLAGLWDHVRPIVAFWDTHDLDHVRDWAMAWETRVGDGRLLVSSLRHDGSPAGEYLRGLFLRHLADGPEPIEALSDELIDSLAGELTARTMDLTAVEWEFRPDREADGVAHEWTRVRVGRSWEGQGFANLDGWATYRVEVEIPAGWAGRPIFLNLDGADDAYEVYFDSKLVGRGGDIDNQITAFDERASHRLATRIEPGTYRIVVRVYDWYGAGGLHRPIRLSTQPAGELAGFLVGR